jgi:hypothetical protein
LAHSPQKPSSRTALSDIQTQNITFLKVNFPLFFFTTISSQKLPTRSGQKKFFSVRSN